eukprot:symbB.v1.2.005856.t1/scaffold335.1/size242651/7
MRFDLSGRDALRVHHGFLRYADLNHLPCSGEPASEFPRLQSWSMASYGQCFRHHRITVEHCQFCSGPKAQCFS